MQVPIQITFRNMPPSEAIEAKIRAKAAKLERVYDRITSCRVVVEAPHRHKHKGKLYHVRVDLTVPQGELVVSRSPDQHHTHTDAYAAVRDAFDAAYRQVESFVARQRGDVKVHDNPPQGRVTELFPETDHGTIETYDGRMVYFHRNSVLNDEFDNLQRGSEVWFAEEVGDDGPQASTVHVLRPQPEL